MESSHAPQNAPGRVITFYSYKGGTGRSMTMANVAWILASRGKRVLVIDWDLEAPGIHRYFQPFLVDRELSHSEGVIDIVIDYSLAAVKPTENEPEADWFHRYANVQRYATSLQYDFDPPGFLDFLSAGRQGASYSTRVNTFDWQNFYDRLGGGAFLEAFKERAKSLYDYVLIDSRTGVSDTSGICTVQMPDTLVVCFTLNNQGIEGAAGIAASVLEQRRGDDFRIYPVPTRVELAEKDKLETRRSLARGRLALFPNSISDPKEREAYWGAVEMLYVPYYAYEEILVTIGDRPGRPTSLLAAAERLTGYLTDGEITKMAPIPEPKRVELVALYASTHREIPENEVGTRAERVYARMRPEQQQDARRLLPRLVHVARPGAGADAAGSLPVADVQDLLENLEPLLGADIVHVEPDPATGTQLVRLGNPALITRWDRLAKWIATDRQFLLRTQQLYAAGTHWRADGQSSETLLAGPQLEAAERVLSERGQDLLPAEKTYVRASGRAKLQQRIQSIAFIAAAVFFAVLIGWRQFDESRTQRRATQAFEARDTAAAFVARSQPDSALMYFDQAVSLMPDFGEAYAGRAGARVVVGDTLGALGDYDLAISLDSTRAGVWANRGDLYSVLGEHPDAIRDYSRAIDLDGGSVDAFFNRGSAYQSVGERGRAIADFQTVLDLQPDVTTQAAAEARLEQLGVVTSLPDPGQRRVFIHYADSRDVDVVSSIAEQLRQQDFDVAELEERPVQSRGDVRSFFEVDRKSADDVAGIVESGLARAGYRLPLQRVQLDSASVESATRGYLEVWLPALSPTPRRPSASSTPDPLVVDR